MGSPLSCVEDYRARARRRIPRFAFDFIDGGAGSEAGIRRNRAAFEQALLQPRVLVDVDGALSTRRRFLGRDWELPFGVPPFGLANLAWPGADRVLAAAAHDAGAPYVASTPASTSLEELRTVAPTSSWFQLYVAKSPAIVDDLLARAAGAGYDTLVVTVDVPHPGRRRRDMRNRFTLPLRLTPRLAWELARHPAWSLAVARKGAPRFANLERYAEKDASAASLAEFMAAQSSGRLDWSVLAAIRESWKGRLIVKGVTSPEDAKRLAGEGADAIVVSNHGGRQLDAAPASLHALPAVRAAVGPGFPLVVDGGVRCGEDVLKALIAGADFVFVGRPFLYAVAARGEAGAAEMFGLLRAELVNAMAHLGLRELDGLGREQ